MSEEYAPERNCMDKIDEQTWWNKVMNVLNDISSKSAEELMKETGEGKGYPKSAYLNEDSRNRITGKISIEEFRKRPGSNEIVEQIQKQMES